MKRIYSILIPLLFLLLTLYITPAFTDTFEFGFKKFNIGDSRETVKKTILKFYTTDEAKYLDSGDIIFSPIVTKNNPNQVKSDTHLYFDHNNILYLIVVTVKYDNNANNLKKMLISRYGQPNDFFKEEFDKSEQTFLVGRWILNNKKYKLTLTENIYCRNQKFSPCEVVVKYLDVDRQEKKFAYEAKKREEEKKKAEKEKYEGF